MPAPLDPPRPTAPRRDYAAEEEAGRRLTNAHIQLRRGLLPEAETAVRALLTERPTDAGAYELLGDIQTARGEFEPACASYQSALRSEPGRVSAEAKFGKATLRQAERQRQEKLGVAYAASNASLTGSGRGEAGKRGGWSVLGSALCPGLGQVAQGQGVKGGIFIGIFVLCLGLFSLLPHGSGRGSHFGLGFWLISIVLMADWLYAVIDAALASSRAAMPPEKDGWQV